MVLKNEMPFSWRSQSCKNENTAMQQEIDAYMADPAFAELERLKGEQQTCEDSLKSDYEALSLKLEEMERAEKLFQQALEDQNGDNAFSDYKTSEELKAINENIAKGQPECAGGSGKSVSLAGAFPKSDDLRTTGRYCNNAEL